MDVFTFVKFITFVAIAGLLVFNPKLVVTFVETVTDNIVNAIKLGTGGK